MKSLERLQKEARAKFKTRKRTKVQKKEDIQKAELKAKQFDSTEDVGNSVWEWLNVK